MLSLLTTAPPTLNIGDHLWVIAVIAFILCVLIGIIVFFAFTLRKLKKANNGYPELLKKEKEEELLRQK